MFRKVSACFCLAPLLVLYPAVAQAAPGDYSILRSHISPHPSPDGVAFDGQSLWISDCQSETVFLLDAVTGATVASYDYPFMVDHLEHRGSYLWMADHVNFYSVDANSQQVTRTLPAAWKNMMGVAEDGSALWSLAPSEKLIKRVDSTSGEVLGTLPSPGPNPCGIAWDGRCLWVSDLTNQVFYQVDPTNGEIVLTLNSPGGEKRLPTGIAFEGRRMWVADEDPGDPKIYELEVEYLASGTCAFPQDTPPDAGPDAEPDAGRVGEAGVEDAQATCGDAECVESGAEADSNDQTDSDAGCSIAPTGRATAGAVFLLSALMVGLLRRRSSPGR